MDFLRIFALCMKEELLEISRQLAELTDRVNAIIQQMETEPAETPVPSEITEIEETVGITEPIKEPVKESEIAVQPTKPIQFTLNDRYRFLREIFGNSVQEMADAVSEIEQMNNAEEVTFYVIHTLNLDSELQITKDFLAAVNERFNERPTLLA